MGTDGGVLLCITVKGRPAQENKGAAINLKHHFLEGLSGIRNSAVKNTSQMSGG